MKLFEQVAKRFYEDNGIEESFKTFFEKFFNENQNLYFWIEKPKMYKNGFSKWLDWAEPEEIEELIFDLK